MNHFVIADDSPLARSFIIKLLRNTTISETHFTEASNGQEVLEYVQTNKVDVIFTDLTMPHTGGLELAKRLTSSTSAFPAKNIVVITSSGNQEERQELAALGVQHILTKPVTQEQMNTVVASLFKGKRKRKERTPYGY
ncbi:response regulator [Chitinivibrio alkaliphilus]|uniref:Response regulator receiver protein n=1 Tax=Chitinivibrio alkaliphilus ACht1 TaxID=1313304 RepID=U7D6L0_9BACT|nr:response regulator [Chitinivibrio alkaliphilus]ERP32154.1 response regulator receiver protein [Chitinivibrio alkaliphilus ACht1]